MRRIYTAFLLVMVATLFYQCQKEVSYIGGPNNPLVPAPIAARLQGKVLDASRQPAAGVTVRVGTKTAITDADGNFRINDAMLDKYATRVTAEKAGYFKAFRVFSATSGTNGLVIQLIQRTEAGTVDAAAGGTVTLSNGATITLPAQGVVVDGNGAAYTGTVKVFAAYIDPTADNIGEVVPGSFLAEDKNSQRVVLASYGMLAVELEGNGGQKLQIKNGAKATLTAPIPASLLASAPADMPMWYVNEATGIWKEEGTATKVGNTYTGEVSHFSFWNYDVPMQAAVISMTIQNNAGQAIRHATVRLTGANGVQAYGYTDTLGQVSGWVPAGQTLLMEIIDYCGGVVLSQNIGPFTQNTDLGVINAPSNVPGMVTITGKLVDCSNNPVANGYAYVRYMSAIGTNLHYASTDANGNFTVTFLNCNNNSFTAEVLATDAAAMQQGTAVVAAINPPTTDIGTLTACGTSATQYMTYTLDGITHNLSNTNPLDSLGVSTSINQGTPGGFFTMVNAARGNTSQQVMLMFVHPTQAAGTYPLASITTHGLFNNTLAASSNIVITNYPQTIGEFYEGSFSSQFTDPQGMNHTISGNFRIRKNW